MARPEGAARELEGVVPDDEALACWGVYSRDCPTRRTLGRVADKWTMLIVGRLAARPMRFAVLRRSIEGLSAKVLTAHLKSLEADGLVRRDVEPARPPRTTYSLTPLGATLVGAAEMLRRWAETHAAEIERHRAEALEARRARDAVSPFDTSRPAPARR